MADEIDYKIIGNDIQVVEIELDPGEGVQAEVGAMIYMGEGIDMDTGMGGGGLFGGLKKAVKRSLAGESFFITTFVHGGQGKGKVGFSAPYPGQVLPVDLKDQGGELLCQKDSFLCAAAGIEITLALTKKIGAGLFGGEGFILQKLIGDGLAFLHAGGTVIEWNLEEGETVRIDTGCLVAMNSSVDYDIQFVKGIKNALFGGEGLLLAKLTGPGNILVQSMPFSRLADRLASAMNLNTKLGGAAAAGGVIGELLDRR